MSWYIHPSKQLREDELPPELVVTNGNGSVEQVYVPYRTCHIVKTWSDSDYADGWRYRCSVCECFIPVNERDPETGDAISAANYCPNCGRSVVADASVD